MSVTGESERIADGKVVAQAFAELGHVVIAVLACVVRCVQTHTEVEADDQEVEVVAQAGACAERDVLSQSAQLELSLGLGGVVAQQPYVAGVEERGAVEIAGNGEAVLHVCLNLEVAHLVYVGIGA